MSHVVAFEPFEVFDVLVHEGLDLEGSVPEFQAVQGLGKEEERPVLLHPLNGQFLQHDVE